MGLSLASFGDSKRRRAMWRVLRACGEFEAARDALPRGVNGRRKPISMRSAAIGDAWERLCEASRTLELCIDAAARFFGSIERFQSLVGFGQRHHEIGECWGCEHPDCTESEEALVVIQAHVKHRRDMSMIDRVMAKKSK